MEFIFINKEFRYCLLWELHAAHHTVSIEHDVKKLTAFCERTTRKTYDIEFMLTRHALKTMRPAWRRFNVCTTELVADTRYMYNDTNDGSLRGAGRIIRLATERWYRCRD